MIMPEENRPTRRKTCPRAILSTKYPTWTSLGFNLGPRDEKVAINRLSDGTAPFGIQTPVENSDTLG
jgi:hypothetical protein